MTDGFKFSGRSRLVLRWVKNAVMASPVASEFSTEPRYVSLGRRFLRITLINRLRLNHRLILGTVLAPDFSNTCQQRLLI